jgi:hypothetical protein
MELKIYGFITELVTKYDTENRHIVVDPPHFCIKGVFLEKKRNVRMDKQMVKKVNPKIHLLLSVVGLSPYRKKSVLMPKEKNIKVPMLHILITKLISSGP